MGGDGLRIAEPFPEPLVDTQLAVVGHGRETAPGRRETRACWVSARVARRAQEGATSELVYAGPLGGAAGWTWRPECAPHSHLSSPDVSQRRTCASPFGGRASSEGPTAGDLRIRWSMPPVGANLENNTRWPRHGPHGS
jgi:hypothetical protein